MGQYYLICNLDKKQYLDPSKFGDGVKLIEFSLNAGGVLSALSILLSDGNGRGMGDLMSDDPIIGSWAGDKIVVAGDYADEIRFSERFDLNLYHTALYLAQWEDISSKALKALLDDKDYRTLFLSHENLWLNLLTEEERGYLGGLR